MGVKESLGLEIFVCEVELQAEKTSPAREVKQRAPGPSVSRLFGNVRMTVLVSFSENDSNQFFPEEL